MSAQDNKELVQRWLAAGVSSPAALEMVTDDFSWISPQSMSDLFEGDEAVLHGRESLTDLPNLDKALYRGYDADESNSNVHFMVAEGDMVVMEFDAAFTTFEGEPYHNQYCLVMTVRDGKIAEVREHADTRYAYEVCMGTAAKHAGVMDRLKRLRAGESI